MLPSAVFHKYKWWSHTVFLNLSEHRTANDGFVYSSSTIQNERIFGLFVDFHGKLWSYPGSRFNKEQK